MESPLFQDPTCNSQGLSALICTLLVKAWRDPQLPNDQSHENTCVGPSNRLDQVGSNGRTGKPLFHINPTQSEKLIASQGKDQNL